VQRRVIDVIFFIHVRAVSEEELDDIGPPEGGGQGEVRPAADVPGVHVGPLLDEEAGDIEIAVLDGVLERRHPAPVRRVHVRAAFNDLPHPFYPPHIYRFVEIV